MAAFYLRIFGERMWIIVAQQFWLGFSCMNLSSWSENLGGDVAQRPIAQRPIARACGACGDSSRNRGRGWEEMGPMVEGFWGIWSWYFGWDQLRAVDLLYIPNFLIAIDEGQTNPVGSLHIGAKEWSMSTARGFFVATKRHPTKSLKKNCEWNRSYRWSPIAICDSAGIVGSLLIA